MALSTFFPCGDTPPPAIFSGVRMANTGHVTQRIGARDNDLGARDLLVLGVRLSLPCVLCAHPDSWAVSYSKISATDLCETQNPSTIGSTTVRLADSSGSKQPY
jgi:hypothetical protein